MVIGSFSNLPVRELARVYRHPWVMGVMTRAESIVHDLFARYESDPASMPPEWEAASRDLPERR